MPPTPKKKRERTVDWRPQYLASVSLIWLAIGLYRFSPYYKTFLSFETQQALLFLAFGFTLLSPLIYIVIPKRIVPPSKAFITIRMLARLAPQLAAYLKFFPYRRSATVPKISEQERVAALFLVVKLFFLPIMINFLFVNYNSANSGLDNALDNGTLLSINGFNEFLFPIIFSTLILIDTAYFVFGYLFEAGFLKNKVKSVEPTVLGWVVALVSYPPFNGILGTYIIWYANDFVDYGSETANFIMRLLAVALMSIYAFSSVALGAKCSNLTNRGIVSRGPYALVRHPAYVSKNMAWWITILPMLSIVGVIGMAVWSFVYFLRAITEERHLIRDPDYQAYCKKVKYRFIPKVI